MKILMIGNKDSGKTTYMASAFGRLYDGVAGFRIGTDRETKRWYERLYDLIESGGYPDATDKRESHYFQLDYRGESVLGFEWMDYHGGVIGELDAGQFMRDIDRADGVMLFFDADALYHGDQRAHRLRRILSLLTQKLGSVSAPLFSAILVVTKVDLLPSVEAYQDAVAPLRAFMENVKDTDRVYARMVPVSCSRGGFYNVELPLLDMLDSGLKSAYVTAIAKAKGHAQRAADYRRRSGILNWAASVVHGTVTNAEMAEVEMLGAQKQAALFQSIEHPMEQLSQYVDSYQVTWPSNVGGEDYRTRQKKRNAENMIKF